LGNYKERLNTGLGPIQVLDSLKKF
jgi:hypothetical protein